MEREIVKHLPDIKLPEWDINVAEKEQRMSIRNRLMACMTHNEDEYKAILSYLHMKFPHLMDIQPNDGKKFQWRYHEFDDKVKAYDSIGCVEWDMYGLVYFDPERDWEPVAVGGSYLREAGAIRDPYTHAPIEGQEMNKHTSRIRCGHGYVLFVDPDYRRMGLARDQWLTEAQLYRDSGVHYQKENQTYAALQVTLSMFKDRSKCHILSRTDLSRVHEGMNTKIIMDYFDPELEVAFNHLPEGLKNFRNGINWHFLDREGLKLEDLVQPWSSHSKKQAYKSKIELNISVDRDLYEKFKIVCGSEGKSVKRSIKEWMEHVVHPEN